MKIRNIILVILITASLYAKSGQLFYNLGDFELISGKVIKECKIGYRTIGVLNSDKSNIVLYPTWFGGTSEQIENLIVKRKFIDTTNLFIVIVDAIGNGISISPSNSKEQPNDKFPEFKIEDMVNSEYLLLKNVFGVDKIYAVIGGSMGSMQALYFAVMYPDFIEKVVGYVFSPKLSSYDLLQMNFMKTIIEKGTKHNIPDDEIMQLVDISTAIQAKSPSGYYKDKDESEFEKYFSKFFEKKDRIFTKYNYYYQLKAMIELDIFKKMDNKKFNQIKKLLIYSTSDHILSPKYAEKMDNFDNTQLVKLEDDCGHMAVDCNFSYVRDLINKFLEK